MKVKIVLVFLGFLLIYGCEKKTTTEPEAKKLEKVWIVQSVTENGTQIYTKGGSSNIRDYSLYKLNLSNPPEAVLTEVDGKIFVGAYAVTMGNKLSLTNLIPAPTGSGGVVEFTIKSSDQTLVLEQLKANLKTGNTKNVLTLITQ